VFEHPAEAVDVGQLDRDGLGTRGLDARGVELLRPRRVVLCHHDDWLPGFSIATDVGPIRREIARVAPRSTPLEIGYLDGTAILSL